MTSENPYSPDRPIEIDHRFFDQDKVLEEIRRYINSNRSWCVIIVGGEGMGKTSILKHIKRMLFREFSTEPTSMSRFIPIHFQPDIRMSNSLREVYQQLVHETISQAKDWLKCCIPDESIVDRALLKLNPISEMRIDETNFENVGLWPIVEVIDSEVGDTRLLFLLDDMFRLRDRDSQRLFVENWLQIASENSYYLMTVMACLRNLFDQFDLCKPDASMGLVQGYHTVAPIYLCVFEREQSREVVIDPFKETLSQALPRVVADEVHDLTGGYPQLLQGTMYDLWADAHQGKSIDFACVQRYIPHWSQRYSPLFGWIYEMITQNEQLRAVFDRLMAGEVVHLTDLIARLESSSFNLGKLRDTLHMLRCLGVVREVQAQAYQISGELMREWFSDVGSAPEGESFMEPILKRADDVDAFLSELFEDVTIHSEFQSLYLGGVGEVRSELSKLLVALRVNKEKLIDTTREAERYPTDVYLDSRVSAHQRGLEMTLTDAAALWIKIRDELDAGVAELSRRVEEGELQAKEQTDNKGINVKLLDALGKVREVLAASLDVTKVAAEYLPVILAIKETLSTLRLIA